MLGEEGSGGAFTGQGVEEALDERDVEPAALRRRRRPRASLAVDPDAGVEIMESMEKVFHLVGVGRRAPLEGVAGAGRGVPVPEVGVEDLEQPGTRWGGPRLLAKSPYDIASPVDPRPRSEGGDRTDLDEHRAALTDRWLLNR